jgi:hypothetical protein
MMRRAMKTNKTVRLVAVATAGAMVACAVTAAVVAPRGSAGTKLQQAATEPSSIKRTSAPDPVPDGYYASAIAQAYGLAGPGMLVGNTHGLKVALVRGANGAQCVLGISGPTGHEAIVSTCSTADAIAAAGGQPFVLGAPDGSAIRGLALGAGVSAASASIGARPATAGRLALVPDSTPNESVTITTSDGKAVSVPAFPHG